MPPDRHFGLFFGHAPRSFSVRFCGPCRPAFRVWVGHDHRGLAFFDGKNFDIAATTFPEVKHLDKKDGLPANIGNPTTIDKNGNIWFGSEEGLSLIDPETKTIRNFGTEDGLLRLNLNYGQHGSLTRLEDGRILVGGMGYFTLFDPARLPRNEEPPPVAMTRWSSVKKTWRHSSRRHGSNR